MKTNKIYKYLAVIYGIIITLFMLLAFTPKVFEQIKEEGVKYVSELPKAFANWYDDPTAFFFTYFIGYIIIWWRPLWGSIIILLGAVLFFVFNLQNMGTLIFIIPTVLVAAFYILYWSENKK